MLTHRKTLPALATFFFPATLAVHQTNIGWPTSGFYFAFIYCAYILSIKESVCGECGETDPINVQFAPRNLTKP